MPLVPDPKNCDISVKRAIQGLSKKLGYTGSPTYVGLTLTGLTASSLVGTNASKLMESVTVSTGLDYTRPTLSLSHLGIEALTDPGADRIFFWDNSASASEWLSVGNSIAITTTTLDTIQDIRTTASPTLAGLTIVNTINEFSTDGTMGGDSDSAIPTEKATKLYTDTLRSDLASTVNAKGASLVGIEDSAAQFDATDVEAALAELVVLVTPVEYNPAMSRTAGGDAGGNDASVATIDDADSYDTDELGATPGFDIQAVFTGVTDFNQVQIHTSYDGNPAHVIRIDLDKTPFNWSSFDTILADIDDNSGNFVFNVITVASAAQYINSGEVRLRFYHSSAGNITHDFFIDYCALWKTGTSVGVTEHGGLTGLDDVIDHPSYLLLDGSRALTGAWDMGSQVLTNVNIDSGVITGITDLAIGDGGTGASTAGAARTNLGLVIGTDVQAYDAGLLSLAGLSYVSASFVKMTGANTFALRTLQETSDDLEATIDHDNLLNFAANEHYLQTAITTVGTIGTGVWQATDVGISYGGTGQSTAQAAINALSAVSGATNEHVLTKDTATGNAIFKASGAGAHTHDGDTLQLDGINSDGGAFSFTTSGAITFSQNIIIGDGKTIGQAAGPLLKFNDTSNYLGITGCRVGIETDTPNSRLEVVDKAVLADTIIVSSGEASSTTGSVIITLDSYNSIGFNRARARIKSFKDGSGDAKASGLGFYTSNSGGTVAENLRIDNSGGIFMYNLKSGANQGAAGAAANELWVDTADQTIKLGT